MSDALASILMALVVPAGWGLLSAWLFDRWRARRRPERQHHDAHGDDRSSGAAR
jgi:hypothetical protein